MILTNHAIKRFRERYLHKGVIKKLAENAYNNGEDLEDERIISEFCKWQFNSNRKFLIYKQSQGLKWVFDKRENGEIVLVTVFK